MDVPSWHPANEDALSRQLQVKAASATQRTEFKLMPGSSPDTTTDAGRELLSELTRGADGGSAAVEGRGFFDSSDRLYLQEQKRLEAEQHQRKREQDTAELQKFRSTALKVQAQKAAALVTAATDIQLEAKKKQATGGGSSSSGVATVVIKAKKRTADATKKETAAKPAKQRKVGSDGNEKKPAAVATKASLLLGYSSSDSDAESAIETSSKTHNTTSTDL